MKINTLFAALCVALTATPFCQAQDDGDFFEKSLVECPVTAEWWPGALFNRVALRDGAQAGDKIIISYEIIPGAESPKFCLCTNYGKRSLPGFEGTEHDVNADENRDRYNMPVSENGTYVYTITQETKTQLNNGDFHGYDANIRVIGEGLTFTKIAHAINENYSSLLANDGIATWDWNSKTVIPREFFTGANEGAYMELVYELLPDATDASFKFTTNYGNRNMPGFPSAEYDGQDGTHVMHLAESGSFIYPITADVRTKLADSSFHGWGQVNITGSGFKMLGLYRREYREPGTGIDAIVADSDNDNAPVEFYNLQGIKVANPANGGVYIRRQGNKVTKVIVR